jgi:arylsulfatase A-like enzyme
MPLALGRDVIGLAPDESTLTTALRDVGYRTGAFAAANPYISRRFGYDQGFEVFEDFLDFKPASSPAAGGPNSQFIQSARGGVNRFVRRTAQALGLTGFYEELYFQYRLRTAAAPPVASTDELRTFPSAEVVVNHAIDWLNSKAKSPFFLWIHLMDAHSPYYPSAEAFRELTGEKLSANRARYLNEFWNRSDLTAGQLFRKRESVMRLYDAGIRAADLQIARLVAHLKAIDCWNSSTFVLTADHGEEFLEHGRRYHAPRNLYQEITSVPLLICVPGSPKSNRISKSPFSHLHLAPTLLEILDVGIPESFEGKSMWGHLCHESDWEEPAVTECVPGCMNPYQADSRNAPRLLSIRTERYKLIMSFASSVQEQLYDLEADPLERQPIPPDVGQKAREHLLKAGQEHLRKTSESRDAMARLKFRLRDIRVELGN